MKGLLNILCALSTFASFLCLNITIEPDKNTTEDVIFRPGDNFNLTCKDDYIVEWTYKEFTFVGIGEKFGKDNIIPHDETEGDMYISKLQLFSVSYWDIGLYICKSKKDIPSPSEKSIYIYVNNGEELLFWDKKVPNRKVAEFVDLKIACRPTLPNIIPLLNYSIEADNTPTLLYNRTSTSKLNVHFDKSSGFNIKRVSFPECREPKRKNITTVQYCCFVDSNTSICEDIMIICRPIALSINATKAYYPVEGHTVQLSCSAEDHFNVNYTGVKWNDVFFDWEDFFFNLTEFNLTWIQPSQAESGKNKATRNQIASEVGKIGRIFNILSIPNLTREIDQSNYQCQLWDKDSNYTQNTSYFLPVWNKTSKFLFIDTNKEFQERTLKVGEDAEWKINVTAWPKPKRIKWTRFDQNVTIEEYAAEENKSPAQDGYSLSFDGRWVTLSISKIGDTTDGGEYFLTALNDHDAKHVHFTLRVTGQSNDEYLNVTIEPPNSTIINVTNKFQWTANISSNPRACIRWFNPKSQSLNTGSTFNDKYFVSANETSSTLQINNPEMSDSGLYSLTAFNGPKNESLNVSLFVRERPRDVNINDTKLLHQFSRPIEGVDCMVNAYPKPNISFYEADCDDYPNCSPQFKLIQSSQTEVEKFENYEYKWKFTLKGRASGSRKLTCDAKNELGSATRNKTAIFLVSDVKNLKDDMRDVKEGDGDDFLGSFVEPREPELEENVTLTCSASKYAYESNATWYYKYKGGNALIRINESTEFKIKPPAPTRFSHQFSLSIINATRNHEGHYICQCTVKPNNNNDLPWSPEKVARERTINLKLEDNEPTLVKKKIDAPESVKAGANVSINCEVVRNAKRNILWNKDGKQLPTNDSRIKLKNNDQELSITNCSEEDKGTYTCRVENKVGAKWKEWSTFLNVTAIPSSGGGNSFMTTMLIAIVTIIAVSITIMSWMGWRIRKEKIKRKKAGYLDEKEFQMGAIDCINPDLNIQAQADLLPYDMRYEFPREKLKWGKQLGSGAFGVVRKAEAIGIESENKVTTVAVKILQPTADSTQIRALASELKIMIHIGRHLNVVNLLGACTRNFNKRKLAVMVEFCRYGNIRDFLLKNRHKFVDQINEETGQIDSSITSINNDRDSLVNNVVTSSDTEGTIKDKQPGPDDEYLVIVDSKSQTNKNQNYQGDYLDMNIQSITTSDLVYWSYQVARGMEYLANRKVLHGDLAARNVLLAEGNIVKICDFGLAKTIHYSDFYKFNTEALLPIKWMALESLKDRIFTIQSDIWSYGVMMWEYFTLSGTPYSGAQSYTEVLNFLENGHRLEQPIFATKAIHEIMLACWAERPTSRPTFTQLAEGLGELLEESVKAHYTELSESCLKTNVERNNPIEDLLNPPVYKTSQELKRYVKIPCVRNPIYYGAGEQKPTSPSADPTEKPIGIVIPCYDGNVVTENSEAASTSSVCKEHLHED